MQLIQHHLPYTAVLYRPVIYKFIDNMLLTVILKLIGCYRRSQLFCQLLNVNLWNKLTTNDSIYCQFPKQLADCIEADITEG